MLSPFQYMCVGRRQKTHQRPEIDHLVVRLAEQNLGGDEERRADDGLCVG